jgi:ribosomal protein S27AE
MTTMTTWRTDDLCPDCGVGLTLADGDGSVRAECASCGYADTWTRADPDGRDADHLGGGDQ